MKQRTTERSFSIKGIGLHSGLPSEMTVEPAAAGSGLVFNVGGKKFLAVYKNLAGSRRGTTLDGVAVVEHFLSAAYGLGLDNLEIKVLGGELPIADGSALPFALALEKAGIVEQAADKVFFELKTGIKIGGKDAWLEAMPCDGLRIEFMVKFEGLGEQFFVFDPEKQSYIKEIGPARTFGYLDEAETLKRAGLALGASFDNALVLGKNGYVNQPRFADELVRHKILDLIGDLALLGRPLHASIKAYCSGHKLNADLVRLILQADES
ncbi:MAG: UDP-3-O-acyl-N-acetylglucosamine deacetylase [Candidatus Margulisbacteria bacterium]|nr:UDP-3-O-acyl-N-acetylglucosamine deacetylase [Candidatus Margulisiibacteriota bacterium]